MIDPRYRGIRLRPFNHTLPFRENEWVYGYFFKFPKGSLNKGTFIIAYESGRPFTDNLIAVDPETVVGIVI